MAAHGDWDSFQPPVILVVFVREKYNYVPLPVMCLCDICNSHVDDRLHTHIFYLGVATSKW